MKTIIAGAELVAALETEKEQRVRKVGQYFESESLCAFQQSVARRGIIGAEVVETIYGFSLRYDSGLQNFGIIVRRIPTLEAAHEAARSWVAQDSSKRYAWSRK